MAQTVKWLWSGGSEAMRSPKELRVRHEGDSAILSPPYQDWADYLQNAPRVGDDFQAAVAEMRGRPLALEDRTPLD